MCGEATRGELAGFDKSIVCKLCCCSAQTDRLTGLLLLRPTCPMAWPVCTRTDGLTDFQTYCCCAQPGLRPDWCADGRTDGDLLLLILACAHGPAGATTNGRADFLDC